LLGLDLTVEAEALGGVADPFSGRLALAGVVVLGAFGDLVEVVALLSYAELADREHPPLTSTAPALCPVLLTK
jgi:hypothetical protein